MPRKMSNRERLLRKRWPKWDAVINVLRLRRDKPARFYASALLGPIRFTHVGGRVCTRRSDAWRSLERAMVRTARALEEKP